MQLVALVPKHSSAEVSILKQSKEMWYHWPLDQLTLLENICADIK